MKNKSQPAPFSQKKLTQAVKTAFEDSDRIGNVMLFNLAEDHGTCDTEKVYGVMKAAGVETICAISEIERIGTVTPEKCRPLRVRLDSSIATSELLTKSKILRRNQYLFNVFVTPDRSKEERQQRSKLVKEMREKRQTFPDKRFYIRNMKICSEDQQFIG